MSKIFIPPTSICYSIGTSKNFDNNFLEVSFTEKDRFSFKWNFAVRNIKDTIGNYEYTWSVLFNDNLYPKNNLVVVVDNPNHIMSYSEMFMGNINDDDVSIEYEQDKLIETIH